MAECEDPIVGEHMQSGDVNPQESELNENEDQDMNDPHMHGIGCKDPPSPEKTNRNKWIPFVFEQIRKTAKDPPHHEHITKNHLFKI